MEVSDPRLMGYIVPEWGKEKPSLLCECFQGEVFSNASDKQTALLEHWENPGRITHQVRALEGFRLCYEDGWIDMCKCTAESPC